VETATVRLAGTVTDAAPDTFRLDTMAGSLVFDGLAVRYLEPMPSVTRVAGTASFSERGLNLRVARGTVAGLELVRAEVDVSGLQRSPPRLTVDASVRGPLAKAVALLDGPPLGLGHELGIVPADVAGTITARLGLALALGSSADLRSLRPTGSATLHAVSVSRLPGGWTLTGGDLALDLDARAVRVTGGGRLQGVPVTLAWREDLDGGQRSITLGGDVDAAGFGALGLDWLPRFEGRAAVQARYTEARAGAGKLTLDVGLGDITMQLPPLDLQRGVGSPGHASVDLSLSRAGVTAIDRLVLSAGGTRLTGKATLSHDAARWRTVDAGAVFAAPAPARSAGHATLTLRPDGQRSRFTLTSDDAGALLEALGAHVDLEGGHLSFAGTVDQGAPGWPLDGQLDIGACRLTRAPVVARAAALVSLSGIANALSRGGVALDRLSASIAQRGEVITIRDARATGPSLGLSVRGTVDYGAGTLALDGTLVPEYYGLNRAAHVLPVVGNVLTGSRKEGVQVFDFQARGPLGNPAVSARASSLGPGAVRDLLRLLGR
jgi:uncharacterized protein YhdP